MQTSDSRSRRIACDLLAMVGDWNPAIGIGSNMGARPVWSNTIHSFLLDGAPSGLAATGAARGEFSLGGALRDGARAAGDALADLGRSAILPDFAASNDAAGVSPLWHVRERKGKAFVDFQHDVTDADVELAAREGFVSIEHLKRYTKPP